MKSRDLAALYESEIKALRKEFEDIPKRAQVLTLTRAHDRSRGKRTTLELRKLDHPYARRHSTALLPLLPLNRHTGKLDAAWTTGKDGENLTVENNSPYILFLDLGTSKMHKRGIGQDLQTFADGSVESQAKEAVDRFNGG